MHYMYILASLMSLRYKKCLNFVWCVQCDEMIFACLIRLLICNNMNLGKFEYMYIKNTNWINAYVHVLWTICTKWFVQCLHQRVVYYRPWFCENSLLSVTTLVKPVSGSYTRVTAPWTWPFVDLKVPKVKKKAAYYWFVQNFSYIWMQKEFWNGDANIIKKKKFLRACNIWLCCSYLNIKTAVMYIHLYIWEKIP